jgi:hypothetical protein
VLSISLLLPAEDQRLRYVGSGQQGNCVSLSEPYIRFSNAKYQQIEFEYKGSGAIT